MEWRACSQSSAAGHSHKGEKWPTLWSNSSGWQREHIPAVFMWGAKKSPKATQSAMSPRNTSTVSPTPSPSIYQCPENSSAVKSAALPQSRDHANALIYPHYVPLLKIKRLRVFCPSSFTFSPCDWSCQCFVRLLWKHVRLEWLRLYVCARKFLTSGRNRPGSRVISITPAIRQESANGFSWIHMEMSGWQI